MQWLSQHLVLADASFDGGNLDCGNGLLLLLRKHMDPLRPGQLLEVVSNEVSVEEDLPAWARLTGNELVSCTRAGARRSYLICKGPRSAPATEASFSSPAVSPGVRSASADSVRMMPSPQTEVLPIAPLSVMGVGSWPRPRWMLQAIHEHLEGRLDEQGFQETADDAVRLAVDAQLRAGVDVVTDGEQRRDGYASFVGSRLDNCQLVPITDLLPYVDDPEEFERELRALDVPAQRVRHPAVLGKLQRSRPIAVHELSFARRLTDKPIKVALPGPYLLTRTMWLECVSDRFYREREQLAGDVVNVLREEVKALLAAGAALVQLDEPVLTEVVLGRPAKNRSFMCGALGARRPPEEELAFAVGLINEVIADLPRHRLAVHICRGNWSRDEGVALAGDYRPLLPSLCAIKAGTFFLEMCTPRAGELKVLADLPSSCRLGLGVVNQKTERAETVEEVLACAERAIAVFGPERLLLNPDCGFATFADNPVASAEVAEAKLAAIVAAGHILRQRHGL
ncbi:MAG: 5-methyltetrahydropteroyltriglutamate--homocysteine methyltransferase [Planctomycetes bacterium]|nr:5-methyltetrahydropteroyltriglutamate--homocysteine methyltransferase [Planctomycetota bacterium]